VGKPDPWSHQIALRYLMERIAVLKQKRISCAGSWLVQRRADQLSDLLVGDRTRSTRSRLIIQPHDALLEKTVPSHPHRDGRHTYTSSDSLVAQPLSGQQNDPGTPNQPVGQRPRPGDSFQFLPRTRGQRQGRQRSSQSHGFLLPPGGKHTTSPDFVQGTRGTRYYCLLAQVHVRGIGCGSRSRWAFSSAVLAHFLLQVGATDAARCMARRTLRPRYGEIPLCGLPSLACSKSTRDDGGVDVSCTSDSVQAE